MRDSSLHSVAGETKTKQNKIMLTHLFRLLPSSQIREATHVIYPKGFSLTADGKTKKTTYHHVVEQWLEDSVKLKECQEEKLYRVK